MDPAILERPLYVTSRPRSNKLRKEQFWYQIMSKNTRQI